MRAEQCSSNQLDMQTDQLESSRKRTGLEITPTKPAKKPKCDQTILPIPTYFRCRLHSFGLHAFESIDEYRQHIIDEHPERQFLCERCPFSTERKDYLNKHLKRLHNNLIMIQNRYMYSCQHCGISFSQKGPLTVHVKTYH